MVEICKRPLIRYHGGKWRLAPWIIQFFPPHRCYVEPFGGGGSVLLRKERSYAEVYNDLDVEVVNLFRVMRDRGDELLRKLELTPFSNDEFKAAFFMCDDPLEQARRTVVRSFLGYGSASVTEYKHSTRIGKPTTGFRACSNRSGTSPAHDWNNYPTEARAIVERLRGVVIDNADFEKVILQHDSPRTLFYADPPYVAETRDKGKDYAHEMTEADHFRLANALNDALGMAVVSGYPSALYEKLFAGWKRFEVAALADGARPRTEVVWINGARQAALSAAQLQPRLIA